MGLHNGWINQEILSIKLGEIKTSITDIYKQNWYACINNSRRLETSSLYKHEFELETYLENISINKFRITITKSRSSNRTRKTLRNTCRSKIMFKVPCAMTVSENEFHLLLVCPNYYDLRRKFLKQYFCLWQTIRKFETLLCNKNMVQLSNLAKFIYLAFKKRNS